MHIRLGYEIGISCDHPTEVIALLDIHPEMAGRVVSTTGLRLTPGIPWRSYEDSHGNSCLRMTVPPGGVTLLRDSVIADDGRPDLWDATAQETPVGELPDDLLRYLLASRYCETDLLMETAWGLFGGVPAGWTRLRAIFDHVHERLTFGYGHARATRTAAQAYDERRGVCRDFAHLAVAFCRCMNIPARYVNGYLGDIGVPADPAPMDFNAWCEVWIGGRWVTLDARHNTPRIGRIVVARGRDAADVPLIHSFGPHRLTRFHIWTHEDRDHPAMEFGSAV